MEVKNLFDDKMCLGYRYLNELDIPSCGGSLNLRNKIHKKYTLYKEKLKIIKKVCSKAATVNRYE